MVAFGGGRKAEDYFRERFAGTVLFHAGEELADADELFGVFFGERDGAAENEIHAAESAALDVVDVGVFFEYKKDSVVAPWTGTNTARLRVRIGRRRAHEPAEAVGARGGHPAKVADRVGEIRAGTFALRKQKKHEALCLPRADAGETFKRGGEVFEGVGHRILI